MVEKGGCPDRPTGQKQSLDIKVLLHRQGLCGLQVQGLAPGTSQRGQEGGRVPAQGPGGRDKHPVHAGGHQLLCPVPSLPQPGEAGALQGGVPPGPQGRGGPSMNET